MSEKLAVTTNCNIYQRCRDWAASGGNLLGKTDRGCNMNTLAFLQALTREQATRFVPSDTGARALGGSSVDDIVQGLNTYYDKLSLGNFFSERTYPIRTVGELQAFFIMLCHNKDGLLKHDECTYARLNRPAGVADHTLVFSKYQDPREVDVFHILTVDPQLQLLWDLPSDKLPEKLGPLLQLWQRPGYEYESISLIFTSSGPDQGPALGAGPAYTDAVTEPIIDSSDLAVNPITPLEMQQARVRIGSAVGTTAAAGGTPAATLSALATAAHAQTDASDWPVQEAPPPLLLDAAARDVGGTAPGSGGRGHKSSFSSRKRIRKKKRSKKKSRKKKRSKKKSRKKKRSKKKSRKKKRSKK